MKKFLLLTTTIAAILLFASCSSSNKMKENAKQVVTTCTPQIMEVKNNEIAAKWTASFPKGYFDKKAILKLQPVLVYLEGEVLGPEKIVQGEAVTDNYEVVPVSGGSASQQLKFDYKPGMEKCRLELRATLLHKGKNIPFSQPYKLADGANTTCKLVRSVGMPMYELDGYQPFVVKTKEGEIKYVVNRSDIRKSELTKEEIVELKKFIEDAQSDPRAQYEGFEVSSYASPEGRYAVNEKLSVDRGKTAQGALSSVLGPDGSDAGGGISTKNTAEDWEGFKELVAESDIPDKDLIIRVLSMYSDSNTREKEIRNMSKAFKILEDKILPELRRSVITAKVRVDNYSDDELKLYVNSNRTEKLDLESLLHAATLFPDSSTKIRLYQQAADKYGDDRAYNNLAAAYLAQGDVKQAKQALSQVKDKSTASVKNNSGLIALAENKVDEAAMLFSSAKASRAGKQNAGIIAIDRGDYAAAVSALTGTNTFNEALALVLTDRLESADKILAKLDDAKSSYLRAVIAARKGNAEGVTSHLTAAFAQDSSLRSRAKNDIEFAKLTNAIP